MKVKIKRQCGHAETVNIHSKWQSGAARVIPVALHIEEGRACHNCRILPADCKQWRHVRYVKSLALDLTAAKTALAAIHLSIWGHSSDYALWSRMEGREGDALLAAKSHDALLPQYTAALDKVSGNARLLTGALVDFANRRGSLMPVSDDCLIPEVNHHCEGNHNHWGQTWRIPHCVLCQNRVSSQ